jgi:Ca-activated chloride channel family protein
MVGFPAASLCRGALVASAVLAVSAVLAASTASELPAAPAPPAAIAPSGHAAAPLQLTLALTGEDGAAVAAGQPIFGRFEARVQASPPDTPLEKVELYLDGRLVGVEQAPPYRFQADAGQKNEAHHLEAIAYRGGKPAGSATLRTGRVQVDLEVDVHLQQVFATVESSGPRRGPLRSDDFMVSDDGEPQQIAFFEHGEVPFTAVLLLDASASMAGPRLAAALDGARAFAAALGRLDEAKLILFADRLRLETPFTSIPPVLELALQGVTAGGGTALNDALYLATKRLESHAGHKVVVVLSDGIDVESVLPMARVREAARGGEVSIYWLKLPTDEGDNVRRFSNWRSDAGHRRELEELKQAVRESGGRIQPLRMVEVKPTLESLVRELRSQYLLGYYPERRLGPGSWHNLKLALRGGGKVRGPRGYVEP